MSRKQRSRERSAAGWWSRSGSGTTGVALVFLALLALAAACAEPESEPGKESRPSSREVPVVLVTVAPQAEMVERIAGNLVQVEVLVPPDADPHTFEPTVQQMRTVAHASLYFLVGHPALEFEAVWRERLAAEGRQLRFVEGSSGFDVSDPDPHIWLSPRAARAMARNLAAGLGEMLPEAKPRIDAGLLRFLGEVDVLDSEIRGIVAQSGNRTFLVYHAAWGWFARDYGLEQIAIERGHVHPGPAHVAELIDRAKRESIRVVFVQPQVGAAQAQAFADEIGGRVVRVDPLARNWFDNLRYAARAFAAGGDGSAASAGGSR